MNILGDFINRVNSLYPEEIDNDQLDSLLTTIKNQGDEIQVKDNEIVRLKTRLTKAQEDVDKLNAKLEKLTEKKTAAAKTTARKTATSTRKTATKAAKPAAEKTGDKK